MKRAIAMLVVGAGGLWAQFEVAAIKPTGPEPRGRYIRMEGHQFVARNHTLKTLIAAAYNLPPRAIFGGPSWLDSDHYDILAKPPGATVPKLEEQMAMLRELLADRFKLVFHRQEKELSIYTLTVAKGGPKLRPGKEPPDGQKPLIFVLSPQGAALPARNASMAEFASVLQRSALDRPVVDKTGLSGRYDFNLEWAPDETQFGGHAPREGPESARPGLFVAIQEQLGLRLQSARGPIAVLVIDTAEPPSPN